MDRFTETVTNDIILGKKKSESEVKAYLDNQALKNWAYFSNNYYKMLEFLNYELRKIISNDTAFEKMPRVIVNDIPQMVSRSCLLYHNQPERIYSRKNLSDEQNKVLNKTYKHYKDFHRLAKTLNTILVRPIWNEKLKKFEFVKLGRHFATAITSDDNQYDLQELIYGREVKNSKGENEIVYFHWTEDNVWVTDENENEISISKVLGDEKATNDNPYKRIPFSVLRLQDSDDFWGDGISTYVNLIEQNNLKLIDALYKQWLSFGYPIGTNLGIEANRFNVAPYEPIMVNNSKVDEIQPSLQFPSPDHKVEEDKALIDWTRKAGGTAQGLSASSMSQDETAMSGYAKTIDNLPLLEKNNDDIEALKEFEIDLFEMMKLESKISKGTSFEGIELLEVNFKKYEFPKTIDEIWKEREFNYKYNLQSELDWLMQDRNGLTEDEAKEILKSNRLLKIELGQSRPTLFEQVNTTPNT